LLVGEDGEEDLWLLRHMSNQEPGTMSVYMSIQHLWYSLVAGSQWVLVKN